MEYIQIRLGEDGSQIGYVCVGVACAPIQPVDVCRTTNVETCSAQVTISIRKSIVNRSVPVKRITRHCRNTRILGKMRKRCLKSAIDDSQEVCETRKTCKKTHKKKGCTRDNVKIDYTRFTILLSSCTIKFCSLAHEKIPLSRA